jgi:NADH:ubiquinone oxidoreductase subunit 6 (subunit J)
MLGALIPFLLLFVRGLDCVFSRVKNRWVRPLALAGLVLFMLLAELATVWRLFPNAYNWFHM